MSKQNRIHKEYKPLERLEHCDVQPLFEDEQSGMSRWVADNIDMFEDSLVLFVDPKSVCCEHPVGTMSADVVAKTIDGRTVVFENQFGPLDSDHIGKGLRYAGRLDADIVVWVVTQVRSESIEDIEIINRHTDFDAYLVVLEAAVIDSGIPGCWPKTIGGPPEFMALAGTDERRKKFIRDQSISSLGTLVAQCAAKQNGLEFKPRGNTPQYLNARSQHRGVTYEIAINTDAATAAIWINSNAEHAESIYRHIKRRKAKIERALGAELRWEQDKTASRGHKITIAAADNGWGQREHWPRTARKTARTTAEFTATLEPFLQDAIESAKTENGDGQDPDKVPNPRTPAQAQIAPAHSG